MCVFCVFMFLCILAECLFQYIFHLMFLFDINLEFSQDAGSYIANQQFKKFFSKLSVSASLPSVQQKHLYHQHNNGNYNQIQSIHCRTSINWNLLKCYLKTCMGISTTNHINIIPHQITYQYQPQKTAIVNRNLIHYAPKCVIKSQINELSVKCITEHIKSSLFHVQLSLLVKSMSVFILTNLMTSKYKHNIVLMVTLIYHIFNVYEYCNVVGYVCV